MPQPWGRDVGSQGPRPAQRIPSRAGALRGVSPAWTHCPSQCVRGCSGRAAVLGSPYCVMKAMQLSTMMGMSARLSCWSRSALPRPPADAWMSVYHAAASARDKPCR